VAGRLEINSIVGEYRIQDFLGAGGMGEVYRAVHSKIGRVVAIKVLTHHDESFGERFLNEARIQASLQHPNVATLYEFLEAHGLPCIVMEYVDGVTLSERIQERHALPAAEALPVIDSVAEAVSYIHKSGVVHRDIKSNNVKIDSRGRVKLLDFGIARSGSSPKLTATGSVVGTMHYLSPELIKGGSADARSDVWALGILLYEMLTGSVPFQGTNTLNLCENIGRAAYRPPSALRPEIPRHFEAIIGRCLRKSPGERFHDAGELLAELRRLRPPDSSRVTPATVRHSTMMRLQIGSPRLWIAGAGAVLAVALGIYFVMDSAPPDNVQPEVRTSQGSRGPASEVRTVVVDVTEGKAEVYRGSERVGSTPFEVRARVGDPVSLVLKRPGFSDQAVQFDVSATRSVYTFDLDRAR
jgi:eukaryotic-like serine/threonine-protein kinase